MLLPHKPNTIFAIGDIHGNFSALKQLMERVKKEALSFQGKGPPSLVFLGDYIDRGPASKQVINFLLNSLPSGFSSHFIMGNHDYLFLSILDRPFSSALLRQELAWVDELGGKQTLMSYGLQPPPKLTPTSLFALKMVLQVCVPPSHKTFFRSLKPFYKQSPYFFAHAGVRPGTSLDQQRFQDLIWIREPFLSSTESFDNHIIVHGHTCVKDPEKRPNRINVDTRAYQTNQLSCAVLHQGTVRFLSSQHLGP